MGMDPKQRRALTAAEPRQDDLPRDTSREAAREQESAPRGQPQARSARPTAAAQGATVNLQPGTPVERAARQMDATPIPELGKLRKHYDDERDASARQPAATSSEAPSANGAREHRDVGAAVTPLEARRTLKARREHSKGDGNFPAEEPGPQLLDERPEDRSPRDVPKEYDDRSAPKGNATKGQEARNPDLEVRDDFRSPRKIDSGFTQAGRDAIRATSPSRAQRAVRPTARRSSSAKRKLTTRQRPRDRAKPSVRQAPKSAQRSGQRAALARRPQIGKRRTGATPRQDAVTSASRGNVPARKARKAKASRVKERRERASRRARG